MKRLMRTVKRETRKGQYVQRQGIQTIFEETEIASSLRGVSKEGG